METPEAQEPNKRRVYRWGTLWGILEGSKWICERRVLLKQSEDYLVESCTPVSCDVLPHAMDDIWEEEYIPLSKGVEYTGLVSVRGDAKFVLESAGDKGLPLPELPPLPEREQDKTEKLQPHQTHQPQQKSHNLNNQNKMNHHPKSKFPTKSQKCLIRD